jgi:hypothetical protein
VEKNEHSQPPNGTRMAILPASSIFGSLPIWSTQIITGRWVASNGGKSRSYVNVNARGSKKTKLPSLDIAGDKNRRDRSGAGPSSLLLSFTNLSELQSGGG